jgi:predicted acylesterase/phospholipase RssA
MAMANSLPDECDIVMEGGVTSGIVYPAFVARLATRFTLRSIGGASVGAIAAIGAAAAQYKRNRIRKAGTGTDDGFFLMATLPRRLRDSIGGRTRLFSLFQPCAALAPHFRVIVAGLNAGSKTRAAAHVLLALLVNFPLGALMGAGLWLLGYLVSSGLLGGRWPDAVLPFALSGLWFGLSMAVSGLVVAALQFVAGAWRGLRRNRCGICSGLRTRPDNPPALTEWLHAMVQEIAGLPPGEPLTFGHLRRSEPPIELALMTTGLSELRAHRLPHSSADLVFRESELAHLFPADIIDWMKTQSHRTRHRQQTLALLQGANGGADDYYFMPDPDDLPVVVAARMSLSFPVLLQAVPLYRIRALPTAGSDIELLRVWFSDGGLTSNFPIHFFDAILPTRPTFGVTLQDDLEEGRTKDQAGPAQRVTLATNNNDGVTPAYRPVDDADGLPSLPRMISAVVRTIRTWRDEALKRTPGYRDRVVLIRHKKSEGGLNLDMQRQAISIMSRSGSEAALRIIERFLDPVEQQNGWLNHRWVRMRSTAAVLQDTLAPLHQAWHDARLAPSYAAMWQAQGEDAPPAYRLGKESRLAGDILWQGILAIPQQIAHTDLSAHAPRPQPELVISPKQS